jgi:hypothetical protein
MPIDWHDDAHHSFATDYEVEGINGVWRGTFFSDPSHAIPGKRSPAMPTREEAKAWCEGYEAARPRLPRDEPEPAAEAVIDPEDRDLLGYLSGSPEKWRLDEAMNGRR